MIGWTEVFNGPRIKAEIIRAALSAAGLHVEELGGISPYMGIDADTVQLHVPEAEADAARELIAAAEAT